MIQPQIPLNTLEEVKHESQGKTQEWDIKQQL